MPGASSEPVENMAQGTAWLAVLVVAVTAMSVSAKLTIYEHQYDADNTCSVHESFRCFLKRVYKLEEQYFNTETNRYGRLDVGVRVTELTKLLGQYKEFMRGVFPQDGGQAPQPFAERVPIDPASTKKVLQFGDIHGSIHSLVRALFSYPDLVDDGYRLNKGYHLVTTGDFTDRGINGVDTYFLWLKLKMVNPDQVTVIRGNHETELNAYNSMGTTELPAKIGLEWEMDDMAEPLHRLMATLLAGFEADIAEVAAAYAYCFSPVKSIEEEYDHLKGLMNQMETKGLGPDAMVAEYDRMRREEEERLLSKRSVFTKLFRSGKPISNTKQAMAHEWALGRVRSYMDESALRDHVKVSESHLKDHSLRLKPVEDQLNKIIAEYEGLKPLFEGTTAWVPKVIRMFAHPDLTLSSMKSACREVRKHVAEFDDLKILNFNYRSDSLYASFKDNLNHEWTQHQGELMMEAQMVDNKNSATFIEQLSRVFGYPVSGIRMEYGSLEAMMASSFKADARSVVANWLTNESRFIYAARKEATNGERWSRLIDSVYNGGVDRSALAAIPKADPYRRTEKYLLPVAIAIMVDSYQYLPTMALLDMRPDKTEAFTGTGGRQEVYMASHGGPELMFNPTFLMNLKPGSDGRARQVILHSLRRGTSMAANVELEHFKDAFEPSLVSRIFQDSKSKRSFYRSIYTDDGGRTFYIKAAIDKPYTENFLYIINRAIQKVPWCLEEKAACEVDKDKTMILSPMAFMWADVFFMDELPSREEKEEMLFTFSAQRGISYPPRAVLAYLDMYGLSGYLRGHQHNGAMLEHYLPELKGVVPLSVVADEGRKGRVYSEEVTRVRDMPRGEWHSMRIGGSARPDHYTTISATASNLRYHINGHVEIRLEDGKTEVYKHWCDGTRYSGERLVLNRWELCMQRKPSVPDRLPGLDDDEPESELHSADDISSDTSKVSATSDSYGSVADDGSESSDSWLLDSSGDSDLGDDASGDLPTKVIKVKPALASDASDAEGGDVERSSGGNGRSGGLRTRIVSRPPADDLSDGESSSDMWSYSSED